MPPRAMSETMRKRSLMTRPMSGSGPFGRRGATGFFLASSAASPVTTAHRIGFESPTLAGGADPIIERSTHTPLPRIGDRAVRGRERVERRLKESMKHAHVLPLECAALDPPLAP